MWCIPLAKASFNVSLVNVPIYVIEHVRSILLHRPSRFRIHRSSPTPALPDYRCTEWRQNADDPRPFYRPGKQRRVNYYSQALPYFVLDPRMKHYSADDSSIELIVRGYMLLAPVTSIHYAGLRSLVERE
jgi:hypothetical protein